ncbi:UNVERIFIED_CONTAM: hypothetical protein PYX00_005140 [Menopon gallinae]|uniref:Uncharacterized protein n=1 Tax=Menopon gallinae TaxID=328185 RepID=A0AAW2HQ91_9NEOP
MYTSIVHSAWFTWLTLLRNDQAIVIIQKNFECIYIIMDRIFCFDAVKQNMSEITRNPRKHQNNKLTAKFGFGQIPLKGVTTAASLLLFLSPNLAVLSPGRSVPAVAGSVRHPAESPDPFPAVAGSAVAGDYPERRNRLRSESGARCCTFKSDALLPTALLGESLA